MARKSALIPFTLWRCKQFCSLTALGQLTYFIARMSPTMSCAGVTAVAYEFWSEGTRDVTPEMTAAAVQDMVDRRVAYLDAAAGELFIPDVIRHEGAARSPTLLERVIRDAQVVRSGRLCQLVAQEIGRIDTARAGLAAGALLLGLPVPLDPDSRRPAGWVERDALKRVRKSFTYCSGRRRLRAEIATGLHSCPCGSATDLQVDHIVSIARGGTNDFPNLQVLCASCNNAKGASV